MKNPEIVSDDDVSFAMDTETTGISYKEGERVIEIGAVEMKGNIITGRTFHAYINPQGRRVDPEAFNVHGISDEFLKDKPTMDVVMQQFLDFVGDKPLVIHNAPFDTGFMNNELELLIKAGHKLPNKLPNKIIDTLTIARKLYPMARNTLDMLCSRFGVDASGRDLHGALIDSYLLAEVYIEMMGFSKLDLGDHPLRRQNMSMAVETLVANKGTRPIRPARPALLPTTAELEMHAAFLSKKIPNSVWTKISEQIG
jgi:DNA polymerase III subunit epsilon